MNLAQQFSNSLWNFKSYKKLSEISGGKSFLYIFLLYLVFYLALCLNLTIGIDDGIGIIQKTLKEDIPDFSLSDGKFAFEGEMPYIVDDEEGNIFIIDTTGRTTHEDLENMEGIVSGLLITEDEIISYNSGKTEPQSLSAFPFELDKDKLINLIPNIKVIIYVAFAIYFIFAFAFKLVGVLVLSVIAMIPCSIYRHKLNFGKLWNIAIFASTAPTLLKLINNLTGEPIPGFFFVYWIIAIFYVFMGIYNMSRDIEAVDSGSLTEA